MSSQEKPTMKTIAEKLGISIGTVDRALKNRGRINENTRRQVLEMADKLGYRPNVLASTLSRSQKAHVVALYPAKNEAFFNEISTGMSAALRELAGYGVTLERMHTVRHSLMSQRQILSQLAERMDRWDALILAAAHPTALNETINAFVDAGKTVITINSDAVGSKRLLFVGQDQFSSGRVAANIMGEFLHGRGKVALFTGFREVWGHEERLNGFIRVTHERYPDMLLVGPYEYQDEEFTMHNLLGEVFNAHPDLAGIYGTTSVALLAAASFLCERGLQGRVRLVGFDTDDEIAQYIREGVIDASILQDPFSQGYYSLKLLARHLMHGWEPQQPSYFTRMEILLRENAHGNERPNFF